MPVATKAGVIWKDQASKSIHPFHSLFLSQPGTDWRWPNLVVVSSSCPLFSHPLDAPGEQVPLAHTECRWFIHATSWCFCNMPDQLQTHQFLCSAWEWVACCSMKVLFISSIPKSLECLFHYTLCTIKLLQQTFWKVKHLGSFNTF